MALIKCPECGREVYDKAATCPNCGVTIAKSSNQNAMVPQSGNPDTPASSAWGIAAIICGGASLLLPYFVSAFLIPAALICGVVAYKKGQKGLGKLGIIFAICGIIWIAYVSMQMAAIVEDPFGNHSILPWGNQEKPIITLDEFERIKEGMSLQTVEAIIGEKGEFISKTNTDGYSVAMYQWVNKNGSNMNALFSNGRLDTKAQFGLR